MPDSIHTEAHGILLNLLVEVRKSAGLTQVELAERMGWPQQSVSFVERGVRRLDIVEFYALARALDLDPAQLFAEMQRRFKDTFDTDEALMSKRSTPPHGRSRRK